MTYNPKTPATEEFVYRIVNESEDRLTKKAEKFESKMDKRFDMVMNTLDKVLKYFKKFDEEHTVLTETSSRNTRRIEKLEKRVFKAS
ncbi:hypothetical protein BH10PAT1_BH10PAT1_7030 [soil metagenome]